MSTNILNMSCLDGLYMYIHQVGKKSKYLEKPDDNHNHDDNIENSFDFDIHGDVRIDKPKNNTCNNQYD